MDYYQLSSALRNKYARLLADFDINLPPPNYGLQRSSLAKLRSTIC